MITIRRADIIDAPVIADIGSRSFYDAFAGSNTPENIQNYLAEKFSVQHITEEISNPDSEFFIAYSDNVPCGYMKLINNPLPEQIREFNSLELQRIYVLKEYYSMKIGKEMMKLAVDIAVMEGYDSIWLGVWQLNHRAVEFYKKWGFEIFGTRTFKLGTDIKDDYLMIKKF
jgi:ribosomal protein S18 acetylase RimI-like enzyme